MKPIQISSCPCCNPETWKAVRESKGTYKCDNCGKKIIEVLRNR